MEQLVAVLPAIASGALALSSPFVLAWLLLRGRPDDRVDSPRPDHRASHASPNEAAGSGDFVIWNVALPRRPPARRPRPGRWD